VTDSDAAELVVGLIVAMGAVSISTHLSADHQFPAVFGFLQIANFRQYSG